jgi:hypothetical protein
MIYDAEAELAEIAIRLLDDAYLAWLTADSECGRALDAWFEAAGRDRATAYLSYRAALDREEAAAVDLQRLWELTETSRATIVAHAEGVRR